MILYHMSFLTAVDDCHFLLSPSPEVDSCRSTNGVRRRMFHALALKDCFKRALCEARWDLFFPSRLFVHFPRRRPSEFGQQRFKK